MAQLNEHAKQLYIDLGHLSEGEVKAVGQPLANVYNMLLGQAKKGFPEDRLIETLAPVNDVMHPCVLQALVGQLRLVLAGA